MAKPLVFQHAGRDLAFVLNKVDRSALYGHKEVLVLNEHGEACELATLADDGRTVIGRGGSALAYLSADQEWAEKSSLKPIDLEGKEISPVASSFAAPIPLVERTSINDYLDHKIRAIYHLTSEHDVSELAQELDRGTIFSFPYSYRGGLQADAGFLLTGEKGNLFMAVGSRAEMTYLGLQQAAALSEDEADDEETDLMDFDMM